MVCHGWSWLITGDHNQKLSACLFVLRYDVIHQQWLKFAHHGYQGLAANINGHKNDDHGCLTHELLWKPGIILYALTVWGFPSSEANGPTWAYADLTRRWFESFTTGTAHTALVSFRKKSTSKSHQVQTKRLLREEIQVVVGCATLHLLRLVGSWTKNFVPADGETKSTSIVHNRLKLQVSGLIASGWWGRWEKGDGKFTESIDSISLV